MSEKLHHVLDVELSHPDIQTLNSSDAIAAFFARLGYNTNARTAQAAGNLGITADGTSRPIKKIELIADQEGLFQVYFQARPRGQPNYHFWKYCDLRDNSIIDNRYIIANIIACQEDTPRIVDPEMFHSVFNLQEKVIADILRSVEQQRALEAAPRSVDPIQQTIATLIQSYLNYSDIDRRQAIETIKFLNQPMLAVQVRRLRQVYREFQVKGDVKALLGVVDQLRKSFGVEQGAGETRTSPITASLSHDDLRLICFDLVTGG